MREAGVTGSTLSPAGGRIEKTGGAPAGVFVDGAQGLIEKVVPQPLPKERDAAFLTAQRILLGYGVPLLDDSDRPITAQAPAPKQP